MLRSCYFTLRFETYGAIAPMFERGSSSWLLLMRVQRFLAALFGVGLL